MTREAIDLILQAWTAPGPFDWHGQFWQGEKLDIIPKPLTKCSMRLFMSDVAPRLAELNPDGMPM